jgi:hypothetical protein
LWIASRQNRGKATTSLSPERESSCGNSTKNRQRRKIRASRAGLIEWPLELGPLPGVGVADWGEFRGRAMPFFVYVAIMAVALFSVALEWDTLVAPSSTTWHEMQAVGELGKPAAQRDTVQPPPAAVAPQPQAKTAAVPPPAVNDGAPTKIGDEAQAQKTAAPQCDVAACTAAYRTFRASDCTYAPSVGVRRLCTKGVPEAAEAQAVAAPTSVPGCHVRACAESYSSFNPQDCTYQPLDGPRQLCKK